MFVFMITMVLALVVESPSLDLFRALGMYALTLVIGLFLMGLFYLLLVRIFVKFKPEKFIEGIAPAQLLAFSTSSSAATLPVTMERVEEHLGQSGNVFKVGNPFDQRAQY